MDANLKIARCKTSLMVKAPFYGSMALSCRFVQQDDGNTMCTDGQTIWWSEDFVDAHSEDEIKGVIAHEIMHIVLKHHLRRGQRDVKGWNIATDYVINSGLLAEGFTLPANGLIDDQYDGMMAEKVYDLLPRPEDQEQPQWGGVSDAKGEGDGQPSPAEVAQMEADIDQRVFMAASAAEASGKLPASIKDMVNRMRRTQVDWMDVIRRFVGGDQPDDYTFRKPNKQVWYTQGVYMPSIDKIGVGDVVVAIDTSGSVNICS